MQRRLFLTLVLALALVWWPAAVVQAQEAGEIPVLVDGLPVPFDVQPIMREGRLLVPFRALAEALNVTIAWDGSTQTVTADDGQTSVRLQVGNRIAHRNGHPILLDTPPLIVNGRTLVPLRFFSEAFACVVVWLNPTDGVRITSPPREMTVIGFYALGDSRTSSWTNLFGTAYPQKGKGNTDLVDELALGWYSLDKEGNLLTRSQTGWQRPEGWEDVLAAAREYNLQTEMVVHVTDEGGIISSLLRDKTAMSRAVKAMVEEARLYRGVNLDFEGLGYQDGSEELAAVRERFTAFVRLLSPQLKAANLSLTLTLHAPNSAYQGYDYRRLGEIADRIIVMAYDYGPAPEPPELVLQAVEMAREVVPSGKLVLGISAPAETAASVLTKVGIAKRYRLAGIALWRLGLVPGEMWEALRTAIASR